MTKDVTTYLNFREKCWNRNHNPSNKEVTRERDERWLSILPMAVQDSQLQCEEKQLRDSFECLLVVMASRIQGNLITEQAQVQVSHCSCGFPFAILQAAVNSF